MAATFHDVYLRTAHDVRHLMRCNSCGGLGDRRRMLSGLGRLGPYGAHHGRCLAERLDAQQLMALPSSERDKLTLADVGMDRMRQLLIAGDSDSSSA